MLKNIRDIATTISVLTISYVALCLTLLASGSTWSKEGLTYLTMATTISVISGIIATITHLMLKHQR